MTVEGTNNANVRNKKLVFKDNVRLDYAYLKSITH